MRHQQEGLRHEQIGIARTAYYPTVQTSALANERNAVNILRRRMDASVLLIKALGGGWHFANLPPLSQARRAPDS